MYIAIMYTGFEAGGIMKEENAFPKPAPSGAAGD
jgi:hypothetical protein